MYKIFIDEKLLILSKNKIVKTINLPFESEQTFITAIKFLKESSYKVINIFFKDINQLWNNFTQYFTPVYAAGGLVKNASNKYLFIRRNGKWDLPKGHIEKGETKELAAVREVEEECSLKELKITKEINTTYHLYFSGQYFLKVVYWYKMDYYGLALPKPQLEENIEEVSWFTKTEIRHLLKNTYGNIRLLVKKNIF